MLDHSELAVVHLITERHNAPHPHAARLGRRDLVADAFAGHPALELREAEQDIQGQPSHGRGGIERLGDADEGCARSEEHTSEIQSLMRISYAVFCLNKKKN